MMGLNAALQLALFAIGVILVLLCWAIFIRRVTRNAKTKKCEQREAHLRPIVLRCLAQDIPDLTLLDPITGRDAKYIQGLIWSMLTKVRGSSREALVSWLDAHGLVEAERRRTYVLSPVYRAIAAERIGNAGVTGTARAVIRLLDDRHADVRIVAARALGKMGNPGAVGPLLGTLDGPRAVPMSLVTMALLHIGPSVVAPLMAYLEDESTNVRGVAAELLGMHGAMSASKRLVMMVSGDPEIDVRIRAANALGRIGSPAGVEVLVRATALDQPIRLRAAAVLALGQIGGSDALGALQYALNDTDRQVSSTAAEALAGLGGRGAGILALVAETEGPGQRKALDWLARIELAGPQQRRGTGRSRRVGASVS